MLFKFKFKQIKKKKEEILQHGNYNYKETDIDFIIFSNAGRMQFKSELVKQHVLKRGVAPLRYVDDNGQVTTAYPFNPNGSPDGMAALCSEDGRHLAMMPHPERTTLLWQWPWSPQQWKKTFNNSPWLTMFTNAFDWCSKQ